MMLRETYFTDGSMVHRIREEYFGSALCRFRVTDAERVFGRGESAWRAFGRFVQCRAAADAHDVFTDMECAYRREPARWIQSIDDPTAACFTCMRRAWKSGAAFRTPINAALITYEADRRGERKVKSEIRQV